MSILISFEGGEGSGKGTISKKLYDHLQAKGKKVALFREPGSVEIAEEIRQVIQKPREGKMDYLTELLLFEAARAQFVQEVLYPSLNDHDVVILDRFYDSTTVYQGHARGLDQGLITWLNNASSAGLVPDMTFVLDVKPETGLKRTDKKEFEGKDRIEMEAEDFHHKIREGYLLLAEEEERFMVVDAENNSVEQVFEIVKEAVEPMLS